MTVARGTPSASNASAHTSPVRSLPAVQLTITGLVCALALLALGVPRDTVIEDYLLSSALLAEQSERRVAGIRRGIAAQRGVDPADVPETDLEALRALMDVRPHYIAAAFDAIDEQFGDVDVYLREGLGVDDARRMQFRTDALE